MVNENFDKAFEMVVGFEGGYVWDKDDPGGETKYGIAKRYHPDVDIKNLTLEEAKAIYRKEYWEPIGADSLPWPVDFAAFDRSVLYGVKNVQTWMAGAKGVEDLVFLSLLHTVDHWHLKYARGWISRTLRVWSSCMK